MPLGPHSWPVCLGPSPPRRSALPDTGGAATHWGWWPGPRGQPRPHRGDAGSGRARGAPPGAWPWRRWWPGCRGRHSGGWRSGRWPPRPSAWPGPIGAGRPRWVSPGRRWPRHHRGGLPSGRRPRGPPCRPGRSRQRRETGSSVLLRSNRLCPRGGCPIGAHREGPVAGGNGRTTSGDGTVPRCWYTAAARHRRIVNLRVVVRAGAWVGAWAGAGATGRRSGGGVGVASSASRPHKVR